MTPSWYLGMVWAGILMGWVLRQLILVYGGARAWRIGRPLFLGLVMGEVFSAVLWALVPVVLIALGGDPAEVGHIVIIPQ